jgi:hypothetical protein
MKIRIFKFSNFHTFLDFFVLASVHRPSVRPFFVRPPARASGTRVLASQPASQPAVRVNRPYSWIFSSGRPSTDRPPSVCPSVRPFRHGNQPYFHENMKIRIFKFSYFHTFLIFRPGVRPPSVHRPSTVRPPSVRPSVRSSSVRQPARLERGLLASQPASRQGSSTRAAVRPPSVRRPSASPRVRQPARPPARASVRPSERSSKF